jgi:hypothetical protein
MFVSVSSEAMGTRFPTHLRATASISFIVPSAAHWRRTIPVFENRPTGRDFQFNRLPHELLFGRAKRLDLKV